MPLPGNSVNKWSPKPEMAWCGDPVQFQFLLVRSSAKLISLPSGRSPWRPSQTPASPESDRRVFPPPPARRAPRRGCSPRGSRRMIPHGPHRGSVGPLHTRRSHPQISEGGGMLPRRGPRAFSQLLRVRSSRCMVSTWSKPPPQSMKSTLLVSRA